MKNLLSKMILELNARMTQENCEREESGVPKLRKGKLYLLGQMSLMVNEKVSATLTLAQTADVDAQLDSEYFVLKCFKEILQKNGLQYDMDSEKIWLPKDKVFLSLLQEPMIEVLIVDPESTLVSKAVKAPIKNKILIREAIACDMFPNLISRIEENGGEISIFLKD